MCRPFVKSLRRLQWPIPHATRSPSAPTTQEHAQDEQKKREEEKRRKKEREEEREGGTSQE